MRALNPREKRTLRIAAAFLAVYLAGFFGLKGLKLLEGERAEYEQLRSRAAVLAGEIATEKAKARKLERLKSLWKFDVAALRRESVVGDASSAIQKAAQSSGIELGSLKEAAGRSSTQELAAIVLDGKGTTAAAMQFLHSLGSLGFPLLVERLEAKTGGMKPGQVQFSLSISILDFTAWKGEEKTGV